MNGWCDARTKLKDPDAVASPMPASRAVPLLVAVAVVVVPVGQAPGGSAGPDPAWLHEALPAYADLPGFVDVAYVREPTLHVGVLFEQDPPAAVPDLHPRLETRAYHVQAEPVTHDPVVPLYHLLAQDIPEGIRPGAWMTAPHNCTMSFAVQDGQGIPYLTTAGHCVDAVGQAVHLKNEGPIGEVVAFTDAGVGADYALVRIDEDNRSQVDPSVPGWGGPTGVARGADLDDGVKHYGWGVLTWPLHESRCRSGAGPLLWGTKAFGFAGVAAFGDSGSDAMLGDGRAAGIVTHLSIAPWQGTVLGTRHTHAIDRLESRTGLDLTLMTGGPVADRCAV